MEIEKYNHWEIGDCFVIRRGDVYFALFVDHDRSSWTKHRSLAAMFRAREGAEDAIKRIKNRAKIRKQERAARA